MLQPSDMENRGEQSEATVSSADNTRHFCWCGWWLRVPDAWRPYRVRGTAERGMCALGAEGRPLLHIQWATVMRRRFNAEKLAQRQMLRGMRRRPKNFSERIDRIENKVFSPMLVLSDPDSASTRCIAYSPVSRRLVEFICYHGTERENTPALEIIFRQARDQPLNQPQRWAFFDISFTAPPGLRYQSSKLDMGDMHVSLKGRSQKDSRVAWRASVEVRHIYPARLALQRQPLNRWMDQLVRPKHSPYALPRSLRRRGQKYPSLSTPHGEGLVCDTTLRASYRPFQWRTPRRRRHWLFHDEARNRLIALTVADHDDQIDATLTQLVEGLHWATE